MDTIIRSGRFYFWPIIAANTVTMTLVVGGDPIRAAIFSTVISLLASFGFLLNDLWDRDIDRVNRAKHFEDSNAATIKLGIMAGVVFLITGLGIAYWLGPREFSVAVGMAVALGAYTIVLRRLLLMPTIVAALLATSPLWSPLVLWANDVSKWNWMFIAAIILMVSARETFMDARDQPGDIIGDRDTVATVFGRRIAKFVGTVITISASVPFVLALVHNVSGSRIVSVIGATIIGGSILFLLLRPVVTMLLDTQDERAAIQRYVKSSRLAMALIPILLLFWSR